MRPPLLLLAFANDKKKPLDQLAREQQRILGFLKPLQAAGRFIIDDDIATTDALRQALHLYGKQVILFHFGGHAGSQELVFPDDSALADGVAALLGIQENLGLVFLNGCSTEAQVNQLLDRGVPAVIATKIPVGDNRACLFAESFYRKLTAPGNESTIQMAFEAAVGSLKLEKRYAELQTAQGPTRCGITLSVGSLDEPEVMFEWGLYYRKEKEAHVKTWTLPDEPSDAARNYGSLMKNDVTGTNDKLTFTLYRVLLPYFEAKLKHIDPSLDMQEVQMAMISSLPYPIGKQFNELFAVQLGTRAIVARQSPERLNKLIDTFDVIVSLLAYVMMAQLWDAITDPSIKKTFQLTETCKTALWESLTRSGNRRKPDLLPLIREIRIVLERNGIEFFIEELSELKQTLDTDTEFRMAYEFLQDLNEARAEEQLNPDLCAEAEDQLCVLFRRLGFCAKYNLASVKQIQVRKQRNNEAEFDHQWARPITGARLTFVSRKYKNYTDPNSVVIWREEEEGNNRVKYLNLSPFIIDIVALGDASASDDALKVYFFDSYDPTQDVYLYKNISNLPIAPQDKLETLEVEENNHGQVKKTFDAFIDYFRA